MVMRQAYMIEARRSPVVPRNGALADLDVDAMAAPVLKALLSDTGVVPDCVDEIFIGNGLYGGGNPARRIVLDAGFPDQTAALTVDRQCCSGLDAVLIGARMIESGAADCVIAGGVESYSRAPIRMTRPRDREQAPIAYEQPPFTPWPERDPSMADAAAALAVHLAVSETGQSAWTVASHARALAAAADGRLDAELVPVAGVTRDAFARALSDRVVRRSAVLARSGDASVRMATTAVAADAAAFVCLVSEERLSALNPKYGVRVVGGVARGGDPTLPGLAPVGAGRVLANRLGVDLGQVRVCEIMEAYAVQAIACVDGLGLDPSSVNRSGGALARGHPIGASGAILAVRLFHELKHEASGTLGFAAIASAGGLGTAALLERS